MTVEYDLADLYTLLYIFLFWTYTFLMSYFEYARARINVKKEYYYYPNLIIMWSVSLVSLLKANSLFRLLSKWHLHSGFIETNHAKTVLWIRYPNACCIMDFYCFFLMRVSPNNEKNLCSVFQENVDLLRKRDSEIRRGKCKKKDTARDRQFSSVSGKTVHKSK